MNSTESPPKAPLASRLLFALAGYSAGTLAILAWGWIAGAVFLLLGGGDAEEPILPFMMTWASALAAPGLLAGILMVIADRPRCSQPPWRWMQALIWTASFGCALGWLGAWLGA